MAWLRSLVQRIFGRRRKRKSSDDASIYPMF